MSNKFLSFVFCLVVNNNSCGKSFPLNIFKLIHLLVFLFVNLIILHLLYYIQLFICTTTTNNNINNDNNKNDNNNINNNKIIVTTTIIIATNISKIFRINKLINQNKNQINVNQK